MLFNFLFVPRDKKVHENVLDIPTIEIDAVDLNRFLI